MATETRTRTNRVTFCVASQLQYGHTKGLWYHWRESNPYLQVRSLLFLSIELQWYGNPSESRTQLHGFAIRYLAARLKGLSQTLLLRILLLHSRNVDSSNTWEDFPKVRPLLHRVDVRTLCTGRSCCSYLSLWVPITDSNRDSKVLET